MKKIQKKVKKNQNFSKKFFVLIFLNFFEFFDSKIQTNSKHTICPPTATSLSFWQRELAKSNSPGSHKAHATLSPDVAKKRVPIF